MHYVRWFRHGDPNIVLAPKAPKIYGDPFDRDPARVLDDVIDGKVSSAAACDDYGVVLEDGAIGIDRTGTEQRRAALRRDRGAVTWVFDRGEMGRQ
jgi:N-methylhydantoinase B